MEYIRWMQYIKLESAYLIMKKIKDLLTYFNLNINILTIIISLTIMRIIPTVVLYIETEWFVAIDLVSRNLLSYRVHKSWKVYISSKQDNRVFIKQKREQFLSHWNQLSTIEKVIGILITSVLVWNIYVKYSPTELWFRG